VNMGYLLLRTTRYRRGSLELNGCNCSSGETSVGMYKINVAMEKSCSDLLASHQRKCDCALAGMGTGRFSSRQKLMKLLVIGTGHKPL
jgi:hypothetical protein